MSTMYRLPLRDKGNSWPFLPLAATTREQLRIISKEGVSTHCRLVRLFNCSHTPESQNCPEEFIYGISWLSAWPLLTLKVGCLGYRWESEIKMSSSIYSLNKYLLNVYYVYSVGHCPRERTDQKDPVPTFMWLTFYWVGRGKEFYAYIMWVKSKEGKKS